MRRWSVGVGLQGEGVDGAGWNAVRDLGFARRGAVGV